MKLVLAGGSGQVGTLLARHWLAAGHDLVVLTRRSSTPFGRAVRWDGRTLGLWAAELDGADALVNLAGRTVNCRYTAANRREIVESRVESTRVLGRAMARLEQPPRVWLQSSTATIYAHTFGPPHDELSGVIGGDEPGLPEAYRFSVGVAKAWEAAASEFELPRTRLVLLRSALTLSPDAGGVFDVLLWLVRRGLGGTNGDGRQFVSWVHAFDFARALDWVVGHDELRGPVNVCAPNPVTNAEFMRTLRRAWGAPFGLPATRPMLEVGARLLGTETELILKSRRLVPGKLQASGFAFEFPTWKRAAAELCGRWRATR